MGCVCHDPRLPGSSVFRGMCAPTPKRSRPARGHGCHDPHRAGHVCPNPQKGRTKRAASPGACSQLRITP